MLIDLDRCTGCYACQVACKTEYKLPLGTFRCRVRGYRKGTFPDLRKVFIPHICNHCLNPPCIDACDEGALYRIREGIVLLDRQRCNACKRCYEACPYDAIYIDDASGELQKCDFCYERLLKGQDPVCVMDCMGKAMVFGDMHDPKDPISAMLRGNPVKVINPGLGTGPSVFYLTRGDVTDTPLGDYDLTRRPESRRLPAKRPRIAPLEKGIKTVNTSDLMCPSECGISVVVEDGVARKIYGNPHSLVNNGTLCAKGAAGLQLTYSPHRIKRPLIRAGERGEERWREVTWEEASQYIAKKLIDIKRRYGAESVFLDTGDITDREAYYRLFHAFGTPNTYNHGSVCDPNRKWGQWIMTGDERPLPDVQRPFLTRDEYGGLHLNHNHDARLIINIGANPFTATRFNYMSYGITGARKENNCIYIVIDPSHTNSAMLSDIWLPIIPGTDACLLAGMLYYIITNDNPDDEGRRYIDHGFIENYTIGWDEFKRAFLEHTTKTDPSNGLRYFTLEWAEEKTGIPRAEIERISHLFGITKPATMEIGMHGTAHHTNGDVTSILMTALCLITGNLDRPGGLVFIDSQKPKKGIKASGRWLLERMVTRRVNGRDVTARISELQKDLYGDYPSAWKGVFADLPEKMKKGITLKHGPFKGYAYPVKALIVRAGNPFITAGRTSDWIEAITRKDEDGEYSVSLMVFIDTHITVTGRYADVILPEAGFLERMGVSDVYTMSPEVALRDQVIRPLYESKTPFEIMKTLAKALIDNGDPDIRAEDFDRYTSEEDFINEILLETPGFYNIGTPLPYPDLPEGCLIIGAPDNPIAIWGRKVIRRGEPLTVEWLRKNNGVAVWPVGYYRYRTLDGEPSGLYPLTPSRRFEFRFSYLEEINRRFGLSLPTTFYWHDCRWNPKSHEYQGISNEYPFQLISGRVNHAMTMTIVCPYLAETETECMRPLNKPFRYRMPEYNDEYGLSKREEEFKEATLSIPVLAFNTADAQRLGIKTGDIVTLENPLKRRIRGRAFLTDEVMPGVIKTAFGPGGQRASGIGMFNSASEYTPNINELIDPQNLSPFTGMPGFGDILVRVVKD
jgi:anaerobic selenocysteine-containing dehydrogenase/Fe-S-cluster-containing dehydrogenase component